MKIAVAGRVIQAEAEALGLGEAGIAALRGIRRVRDDPDRPLPSEARALLELRAALLPLRPRCRKSSWPRSLWQSCSQWQSCQDSCLFLSRLKFLSLRLSQSRCTGRDEGEAQVLAVDVVLPGRIELSLCVVDIEVRAAR